MKIPVGYTEQQVVDIIYKVVKNLSYKFRFGYLNHEDLAQEGAVFAIQALNNDKFDPSRPLENFLYTHIRNRFINYKRDKYVRNEPPCKTCPFFDPMCKKSTNQCAEFPDKMECQKFNQWFVRNSTKKNLMRPSNVPEDFEGATTEMDILDFEELQRTIDECLPVELRSDYLRMRAGQFVPKLRRDKVKVEVLEIIKGGD